MKRVYLYAFEAIAAEPGPCAPTELSCLLFMLQEDSPGRRLEAEQAILADGLRDIRYFTGPRNGGELNPELINGPVLSHLARCYEEALERGISLHRMQHPHILTEQRH